MNIDVKWNTVGLLNEAREKTEELIDELQMYETKTHRIVSLSQPHVLQAARHSFERSAVGPSTETHFGSGEKTSNGR